MVGPSTGLSSLILCISTAPFTNSRSHDLSSSGCGREPPLPDPQFPEWYRIQVDDPLVGSVERWFQLHIPRQYDRAVPTPLVFDIHGYSSGGNNQREQSWVSRVADAENFIVVYPDGLDDTAVRYVHHEGR
eukprot:SAG11_NODE_3692_length_2277_cov_1.606979_1_plen_131_part_00